MTICNIKIRLTRSRLSPRVANISQVFSGIHTVHASHKKMGHLTTTFQMHKYVITSLIPSTMGRMTCEMNAFTPPQLKLIRRHV